jgi:ADP-ribosylglycohydrolase
MHIPVDYTERVYAGVLGKIIGVYLGRPFEGWDYDKIMAELGEVWYYVHEKLSQPLIVTDDDISGTFTFLRALPDYGNSREVTAAQIGQTWLNYLVEKKTVLWWGGMGNSTEHTAYLRLKHGIPAPRSGSIEVNGKVVAEQIGSQIFIDGWGMVSPGDPEQAADLARKAGSVSHDGEAIYGAQVVAAIEAQAFVERDMNRLLDTGISFIPRDSVIFRLIADLREWHSAEKDWRKTREKIVAKYGYDKYGGNCHMVPNHALIIHALLHGEGDFQKSLMIVNTCGWDTDCNSGNVGCILGIRNGLAGIDNGPDWRGPVADRLLLPTADGGRCISDAVRETVEIVNIGRALQGQKPVAFKNGARFHFELPGSVQGFGLHAETGVETTGVATVENVAGHSHGGRRSLAIRYRHLTAGRAARVSTPTFATPETLAIKGYALFASPTLYPGQTLETALSADAANGQPITCRLYLNVYDKEDRLARLSGPETTLQPDAQETLTWPVPDTGGYPIAGVGVELISERPVEGTVYLDYLTWSGTPNVTFGPTQGGNMWRKAFVEGVDRFEGGRELRPIQDEGIGLLIQGCREWTDYKVSTAVTPHMVETAGLAARVQGMRRYYALLLARGGKARLVKALDGYRTLAEIDFPWQLGTQYELTFSVTGSHLKGFIDGQLLFEVEDADRPLTEGAIALVVEEGRLSTGAITVERV